LLRWEPSWSKSLPKSPTCCIGKQNFNTWAFMEHFTSKLQQLIVVNSFLPPLRYM
jgi:hypothetical protein